MTQFSSTTPSGDGYATAASPATDVEEELPHRYRTSTANETTEIIPLSEFGDLSNDYTQMIMGLDLDDFEGPDQPASPAQPKEICRLLQAPELDDLHHADNLPALRLERAGLDDRDNATLLGGSAEQDTEIIPVVHRAKHRREPVGALRGRLLIAAMATGAVAAGAHTMLRPSEAGSAQLLAAADESVVDHASSGGMQMISIRVAANVVVHNEELAKGVAYAQERAEREARLQRPLFATPTRGILTSSFGYRWGALHGGIDIANSVGTPVLSAADGTVIEAGPSAGYGNLVKVRHYDGTVTLYGHLSSVSVGVGERIMAGDQIALMGSTGYSTGPHLHFEVLRGGTSRIDPAGWLAERGISVIG